MTLSILYEDNHLLIVDKPAGLPSMGVAAGKPSLIVVAKEYLRDAYNKPGNVYLGTVSRLDAPVTGVLVFARTSKAAARLNDQFRSRRVEKIYWAIVAGRVDPPAGECVDYLRKDERHRKMHICNADTPGAQEARLRYRTLHHFDEHALLEIQLETGRKHQIRLQLSHRGHPIAGDRKYGSDDQFPAGIALHARRLAVRHPTQDRDVEVVAPLPKSWAKWVPAAMEQRLDGD